MPPALQHPPSYITHAPGNSVAICIWGLTSLFTSGKLSTLNFTRGNKLWKCFWGWLFKLSFLCRPWKKKKHLQTQSGFVCVYKSLKGNMSKNLCVSFFGLDFVTTASCLLFPTRANPKYFGCESKNIAFGGCQWAPHWQPQRKWWRLYHGHSAPSALQIFNSGPDRLKRQQNSLNTIKLFKDQPQQSPPSRKPPLPLHSSWTPVDFKWRPVTGPLILSGQALAGITGLMPQIKSDTLVASSYCGRCEMAVIWREGSKFSLLR